MTKNYSSFWAERRRICFDNIINCRFKRCWNERILLVRSDSADTKEQKVRRTTTKCSEQQLFVKQNPRQFSMTYNFLSPWTGFRVFVANEFSKELFMSFDTFANRRLGLAPTIQDNNVRRIYIIFCHHELSWISCTKTSRSFHYVSTLRDYVHFVHIRPTQILCLWFASQKNCQSLKKTI